MAKIDRNAACATLAFHMLISARLFDKPVQAEELEKKVQYIYPMISSFGFLSQEETRLGEIDKLEELEKSSHGRQRQTAHQAKDDLVKQVKESLERHIVPETEPAHITRIPLGDLSEAAVVRHGGQIGVYFRQTTNMTEFGSDATISYHGEPNGGVVGEGYAETLAHPVPRSLSQEWQDLTHGSKPLSFQQAIETQLRQEVAAARAEGREPEITVAGISRGGALAQLAASHWMEAGDLPVRNVYTISAPMVGDQAWADRFNKMTREQKVSAIRMEIGGDIVPRMPPLFFAPAGQLLYYPGAPELGNHPILNPSNAFLQRDGELISQHNSEKGRNSLMESIKFHLSGEFLGAYISHILGMTSKMSPEGDDAGQKNAQGEDMVIIGGSRAEAALLQTSVDPVSVPRTPVSSLLPRFALPSR